MVDILKQLVENSQRAIYKGTYEINHTLEKSKQNFVQKIQTSKHPILITEIKFASPSKGKIRDVQDPIKIAKQMINGGTSALSILTQPYLFNGSPEYFMRVRNEVNVPMLMKDIIIHKTQIDAAYKMGADMILLIQSIFDNNLVDEQKKLVQYAHELNLDVLIEVHTRKELQNASRFDVQLIGINNRNLDNMSIDLNTSCELLEGYKKICPVISESGIYTPEDIIRMKSCGADAFLIGSSIMESSNIEQKVKKLVDAY